MLRRRSFLDMKIFIDFDGTLAYKFTPFDIKNIGPVIPEMFFIIQELIKNGHEITIFTGRVGHNNPFVNLRERWKIKKWLKENKLPSFPITAFKRANGAVWY